MLRDELIKIISCPKCHSELQTQEDRLLCVSCDRNYPIINGIPIFVNRDDLNTEKQILKDFYETFGWRKYEGSDIYNSPLVFGFNNKTLLKHRVISNRYHRKYFNRGGNYFLDCASGAIPCEEYLEYSRNFDFHVCVDLTLSALNGAKNKLGEKGLYVNSDATCLAFADNIFDVILSSHTLYHIPKNQQGNAIKEFHRVLKKGGKCIIYYNVGYNSIFGRILSPFLRCNKQRHNKTEEVPPIYSYSYSYEWFKSFVPPFASIEIRVHRFLPNQFMKYLFPNNVVFNFLGDFFIYFLRQIEKISFLARYSQFITVIYQK